MKVCIRHDGFGNFQPVTEVACDDKTVEGMQLMLRQVAQSIGQSLFTLAVRSGTALGPCLLELEGADAPELFHAQGFSFTITSPLPQKTLEPLLEQAVQHCFPTGSSACQLKTKIVHQQN